MSSASLARGSVLASSLRLVCIVSLSSKVGVHAPGIEDPMRIELLLQSPMNTQESIRKWMERFDVGKRREAGRVTSRRCRDLPDSRCRCVALEPALRARPVNQHSARKRFDQRIVRYRQTPERTGVVEEWKAVVTQRVPEGRGEFSSADAVERRSHRARGSFEPDVEAAVEMACAAQGECPLAPRGKLAQRLGRIEFKRKARLLAGLGQNLKRHLRDDAEATKASGE